MVQEPALVMCTLLPFAVTVQFPEAANVTGRPELAVALTEKSASPNVLGDSALKVIVWLAFATTRLKGVSVVVPQLSVARIVMVCVPAGAALLIETTPVELLTEIVPVYVP